MAQTPGPWAVVPWRYDPEEVARISGADGGTVVGGEHGQYLKISADDARLMAAAPELLAACKAALDWMGQAPREDIEITPGDEDSIDRMLAIRGELKAAIAIAEGR